MYFVLFLVKSKEIKNSFHERIYIINTNQNAFSVKFNLTWKSLTQSIILNCIDIY